MRDSGPEGPGLGHTWSSLKRSVKTHWPPPSWLPSDAAESSRRAAKAAGDRDIYKTGAGQIKDVWSQPKSKHLICFTVSDWTSVLKISSSWGKACWCCCAERKGCKNLRLQVESGLYYPFSFATNAPVCLFVLQSVLSCTDRLTPPLKVCQQAKKVYIWEKCCRHVTPELREEGIGGTNKTCSVTLTLKAF